MTTKEPAAAEWKQTETPKGKVPKTFAALKHRNFQLYFGGQLVSMAGTWMQIIAQSWLVYQLSHSESALGIVAFASAIPVLILTPIGGVVVDRVPKRNLLVVTQAAAMMLAFIQALITFTGIVQVWHIVALAACLGVVNAFDAPARQAFVVDMVGREHLTNGIALNSMMFNGARVIGPAVGGLLLAAFGPSWCFLINGFSFLAVIASLLAMRVDHQPGPSMKATPIQQLKSGLKYSFAHQGIFALLLLSLIFSVFGLSYSAVLPAFVDLVLKAGAAGYGAVNTATGFGAVLGAYFVASHSETHRRGRLLIVALFSFSAILAAFGLNSVYPLALVLAFGLGLGFMLVFTFINTMIQTLVEDSMRGRVLSLYTITFFGFAPFGNLAMGYLSERWGLSPIIALSAGLSALLAFLVIAAIPKVKDLS